MLKVALVAIGVLGAAAAVVAASAAYVGVSVVRDAEQARTAFSSARAAVVRQDAGAARVSFEEARVSFANANARLEGMAALPIRVAPMSRDQVAALRAIARAGAMGGQAGRVAADAIDAAPEGGWSLRSGRLDLGGVARASGFLRNAASFGERALDELAAAPTAAWLAPPVRDALVEADELLTGAVDGLRRARDGLEGVPSLLGRDGTKRYLVAFANLAEQRGTGGFLGFYTIIEATDGQIVHVDESGRPTHELPDLNQAQVGMPEWFDAAYARYGASELWQNVNMPVDFPAPARLMAGAAGLGLGPLDGVIQIDPAGISALLELTGPIRIPSWPAPIDARNVEEVTQHRQYVRFADSQAQRTAFDSELITAAFDAVLSSELRMSEKSLDELGAMIDTGHVKVFATDPSDQAALEAMGVSGAVARVGDATDVLSLVTQNSSGTKMDWFLRREVVYRVELDPVDGSATTLLTATLANGAPARGLPSYVIGPNVADLTGGQNRHILVLVRSPEDRVEAFEVGGRDHPPVAEREGELRAYHSGMVVGPGGREQLLVRSTVPGALEGTGNERTYRLRILAHPVAHPDFLDVHVAVPAGWTAVGPTTIVGDLEGDVTLEVKLRKTARASFVDRIPLGPLRRLGG